MIIAGATIYHKVQAKRKKDREAKQGVLEVGDSDVAKRAFANQTQKTLTQHGSGTTGIARAGTDIKFEDPKSLENASPSTPETPGPGIMKLEKPEIQDTRRHSPEPARSDTVHSEKAQLGLASPGDERSNSTLSPMDNGPPPYSASAQSSTTGITSPSASSGYSRDTDGNTLNVSDTRSTLSSNSSNSSGFLRITTKGADLKSGFSYHPALFDLQVHPSMWDDFTRQVIDTTKFSPAETARMWAAAAATASTGFIGTSVLVGRTMNRKIQEKKVKDGLVDTSAGGLATTLESWNDNYFRKRGLNVHMELSASAMKNPDQSSKVFRKHAFMYSDQEERNRKREERKFVLVIGKVDDTEEGGSSETVQELAAESAPGIPAIPEMDTNDVKYKVAEMPGDLPSEKGKGAEPGDEIMPVELPAFDSLGGASIGYGNEKFAPPIGYAELPSDTTELLEQTNLDEKKPPVLEEYSSPNSLALSGARPGELHKEIT